MVNLSPSIQWSLRLAFHASLSGAFLVAYLTGDEDTYQMHVFAGYLVLITAALRVLSGVLLAGAGPLRLPALHGSGWGDWLRRLAAGNLSALRVRNPLMPLLTIGVLAGVAVAAATGVAADALTSVEKLHESLADVALWLIVGHVALVALVNALKYLAKPATA